MRNWTETNRKEFESKELRDKPENAIIIIINVGCNIKKDKVVSGVNHTH